jgi:hypothetical protein
LFRYPDPAPDASFDPENRIPLCRKLNKLFFLAAIKRNNASVGISRIGFQCYSCSESLQSIQISQILFLLHAFSVYNLRERVNFQRAFLNILLDVIPAFLYNKTERARFICDNLEIADIKAGLKVRQVADEK